MSDEQGLASGDLRVGQHVLQVRDRLGRPVQRDQCPTEGEQRIVGGHGPAGCSVLGGESIAVVGERFLEESQVGHGAAQCTVEFGMPGM